MVPAAISVIHCHFRWQDGSLWHWPLADPTLSPGGRRIELGATPLSDIRIYLNVRAAVEEVSDSWFLLTGRKGRTRWSYTTFCLPQEAGDISVPVYTPRTSLCASSSFSASLRFIPHLETKTDAACGGGDLSCVWSSSCLVLGLKLGFSEHGPFGFIGPGLWG